MSTEDTALLLAQLKEIHLPEAPVVPFLWPVVLALTLVTIALLLLVVKRHPKKSTWANEAINTLKRIEQNQSEDALLQTASLLRRVMLTHDTSVRHQTGDTWLNSLDKFFNTSFFSRGDGRIFGHALYTDNQNASKTLFRDLEQLIRNQQRRQQRRQA